MKTTSRILAAVAAFTGLASVVACGAPPDGGESTGSTSQAATCLTCGTSPGTGSSGSGGTETEHVVSSCTLIAGTSNTANSKLPYVTNSVPSSSTVGAGWESYSTTQYQTAKAKVESYCASDDVLLCFLGAITYAADYEPWVFENNLADALSAADPSAPDVTKSAPLVLATNDPTALLDEWYGIEIDAAQATNAGVLSLINTYDTYYNQGGTGFAVPQLFSCTQKTEIGAQVLSSKTTYYVAWDPNCGDTNCAATLTPRISGLTLQ